MNAFAGVALLLSASGHRPHSVQQRTQEQTHFTGCGTVENSSDETPCGLMSFPGEVSSGELFERTIGGNLSFRLNPSASGWTVEIISPEVAQRENSEYSWVVTPPYRSWNPRYLDTTYGTRARDSVSNSPRQFNFVLNGEQYKKVSQLVELAIVSHPLPDTRSQEEFEKESQDATAALMRFRSQKGNGGSWTRESRIRLGSKIPARLSG